MDNEHRVGLKPVLRRVWAPRGRRPIARGHHRFEWMYVYSFVRPSSGAVVWFLADGVGAALFSHILAAFAREVGAGAGKRVLLVLDGAGERRLTAPHFCMLSRIGVKVFAFLCLYQRDYRVRTQSGSAPAPGAESLFKILFLLLKFVCAIKFSAAQK